MDAKITKLRLSRMLSYDWLKIVGLAAAIIFVWVLIFTTTATRVLSSQQFVVCNYLGNVTARTELTKSLQDAKFSYDVLETNVVDLNVADLSTASQLLQARTSTDELDVMFVSQRDDVNSTSTEQTNSAGEKETTYANTYLETFVYAYRYGLHDLDPASEDGYFADLAAYLNKFYDGGYETGTVNREKVEGDFRARIARMKDKRYKKEAEIQAGIDGEIDRLAKYRQALISVLGYFEAGYIETAPVTYTPQDKNDAYGKEWTGVYAINICPDTETMGKLANVVAYSETVVNEEGKTEFVASAKDMCVCLFDSNGGKTEEECYRYEGLIYLHGLIESVLTAA